MRTNRTQKGFTLLELLMYVAGMLALGAVMIVLIVQFYGLYKEIISIPRADRTALLIMDRLTKDLRAGDDIDPIESNFLTTNGAIEFASIDDGDTTTKRYYVENGLVKYRENADAAQNITPKDLYVSNFNLALVTTDVSEGVRITMEIQFQGNNGTDTRAYTGFAILRESYE